MIRQRPSLGAAKGPNSSLGLCLFFVSTLLLRLVEESIYDFQNYVLEICSSASGTVPLLLELPQLSKTTTTTHFQACAGDDLKNSKMIIPVVVTITGFYSLILSQLRSARSHFFQEDS